MNLKLFAMLFALSTCVRISAMQKEEKLCPICWQNLYDSQQDVITLACHRCHKFHLSCINTWNKKAYSCPLCRTKTISNENEPTHFANYTLHTKDDNEVGCLAALGIKLSISISNN